mmetsp:Transcript_19376/g.56239  ORF Transcript_19376/g.56239 Transcript_19376/m.56239 type:complete len:403 (-) Transcript_19376:94-1302(-)
MSSCTSPAQSHATSLRRVKSRSGTPRLPSTLRTELPYSASMSSAAARRIGSGSEASILSNSSSRARCCCRTSRADLSCSSRSLRSSSWRSARSMSSRSACSAASRATCSLRCSSATILACFSASSSCFLRASSLIFSFGFQPCGLTSRTTGLVFRPLMTTSRFSGTSARPFMAWTSKFAGTPFCPAKDSAFTARIRGGKPPEKRSPRGPVSSVLNSNLRIPSSGSCRSARFRKFGARGGGTVIASSTLSPFFLLASLASTSGALLALLSLLLLLDAFFLSFFFFFLSFFGFVSASSSASASSASFCFFGFLAGGSSPSSSAGAGFDAGLLAASFAAFSFKRLRRSSTIFSSPAMNSSLVFAGTASCLRPCCMRFSTSHSASPRMKYLSRLVSYWKPPFTIRS